ncbi:MULTISPECIES: RDD family protein [unclassified Haloferax]|uniref:RDD family protein n=1 Tax=Haloferax TaxID=2251 RepID=UPI0002AFDB46|nr:MULTISPECIES: RDD family protein [unclassified Haloferax]ELZ58835.1 RDD domain-containing protein [Haloferax sp. ATCC BAA-646]ELZ62825.1 RDD domain-containing protein [Haloferax sp. ATCC BAA-644]ELZ64835.1 RDD domain-containing protein [Haloferax sp. ATCC BAA-645]
MEGYNHEPTRDDTDILGARIGAQLIDTFVGIFLAYIVFTVFGVLGGATGDAGGAAAGLGIGIFGSLLTFVGYFFLLEGLWDGQTVGKRLLGIKVVKEDGSTCDIGSSFMRNILRIIDGFFYYVVGFIVMAISDKRQRVGDRLAGTVVVREQN